MDIFMIRVHPSKDLVMIQVDNMAIQLDKKHQEKVYKFLKERLDFKFKFYMEKHEK